MIYFFDPCGRITRALQAPLDEAHHIAQEGEQWLEVPEFYSDSTHYIQWGAFQPFPPNPHGPHGVWDWYSHSWTLSGTALEDVKAEKRAEVDAWRDKVRYSGVSLGGYTFDSDPTATVNITGWMTAVNAGIPLPEGFSWRTQDNNDIPFQEEDVKALAAAIVLKTALCYQRAWALKAQINEFTDPNKYQELQTLDITTNWPE